MLSKTDYTVSVIIPAHNAGKYLGEAIESVLAQTFKPFEIIVIDDGSGDHTHKVACRYLNHIQLIKQDQMGTGFSRNRGIEKAQGKFIAHLDADDLWEPNKLAKQFEVFNGDDDIEITGCLMKSFYSPEIDPKGMQTIYCPPEPVPSFSASAVVIKEEVYSKVGLYPVGIANTPDLDWFIRVREHQIIEFMVNEVLCHRRLHKSNTGILNKGSNKNRLQLLKSKLDRERQKKENK